MDNMEPIQVDKWSIYIKEHPKFTGCLIERRLDE